VFSGRFQSRLRWIDFRHHGFYKEQKLMGLPYSLGWITYFKDGSSVILPNPTQGVVIEQYAYGKFVFMSRDEEYSQGLSLAEKREKVLNVLQQLSSEKY
jgi:hypothetical protein